MKERSAWSMILRGAIGGMLGGGLWVFLIFRPSPTLYGNGYRDAIVILSLFELLPLGLISGIATTVAIYQLCRKVKKKLGLLARVAIGIIVAAIFGVILFGLWSRSPYSVTPVFWFSITFGFLVGITTALITGQQNYSHAD